MWIFGAPDVEKMKAKRNVKGLIRALGYRKDYYVCRSAVKALGEIGDWRATDPLIATLEDGRLRRSAVGQVPHVRRWSAHVRRSAVEALGDIGDSRAVAPLIAALKAEDVRDSAVESLEKLGWEPDHDETGALV